MLKMDINIEDFDILEMFKRCVLDSYGVLNFASPEDFIRHQVIFYDQKPSQNLLTAHKVRALFIRSKIPIEDLSKIWILANKNVEDLFTLEEFSVCLRLIQSSLCGVTLPNKLPTNPINHVDVINVKPISVDALQSYELIFNWLQPDQNATLGARDVFKFLFCSKMKDEVLARIWTYCDIDCDGRITVEEFAIALHLTIVAKTSGNDLKGVIDTSSLFPQQFRRESISEKENRLVKLKLQKKYLQNEKNSTLSEVTKLEVQQAIDDINQQEVQLKEEIRKGGPLYGREGISRYFEAEFLMSQPPTGADWIKKMRSKEAPSRKLREPEKIFEGDNILKYSKTLVVKKRLEPRKKSRSDFQRRLTSDLIELTEEIEKLRRDTSSNFEELNKEFEQVKASVGKEEFIEPAPVITNYPETSSEKKSQNKNENHIIDEEQVEAKVLEQVENEIKFEELFKNQDKLLDNDKVTEKENVDNKIVNEKEETCNTESKDENLDSSLNISKSRNNSFKRNSLEADSKNNSLNRRDSDSQRRNSSKRNSLKRRLRAYSVEVKEQDLAGDFTKLFQQLSTQPVTDQKSETDVKSLIEQISTPTTETDQQTLVNLNLITSIDTQSNLKPSTETQSNLKPSTETQSNLKPSTETQSNLKPSTESILNLHTSVEKQTSLKTSSDFQPESVLSKGEKSPPNSKSKHIKSNFTDDEKRELNQKQPIRKADSLSDLFSLDIKDSTLSNTNKNQFFSNQNLAFDESKTEEPELDLKKVFQNSKNIFENPKKHLLKQTTSVESRPSIKELKYRQFVRSQTVDQSTNNNKNKQSFVDHSVKELLRNLSFKSRTRLLFIDELDKVEDRDEVRSLLDRISYQEKSKRRTSDVRTILRDLSFNSKTMEAKEIEKIQNDPNLTDQEKKRLQFEIKNRRRSDTDSETNSEKALTLDHSKLGHLSRPDMQSNLFFTGDTNVENNHNGRDRSIFYKNGSSSSLRESNDTFYNEKNAEEKRKSFTRSSTEEMPRNMKNKDNEEKKTKRVIRTKSGRVVKIGPGLINREDPSQVTFKDESEWLEKLCEEAAEANKGRDLSHEEKRNSQDFLSFGFPLLPSADHTRIEPPQDKTYEEERNLRRSKSIDVIEEKTSLDNRKSWLNEIIVKNKEHENNIISKEKPRHVVDETITPMQSKNVSSEPRSENIKAVETKPKQNGFYKNSPNMFIEPKPVDAKQHPKEVIKETSKAVCEIISYDTPLEEQKHAVDDENRGKAYMLPSALRKQKSEQQHKNNERRHTYDSKKLRDLQIAAETTKVETKKETKVLNTKQEQLPEESKNTSTKQNDDVSRDQPTEDVVKLPSVKDKLKVFQQKSLSKTDDVVVMRNKYNNSNAGKPRPKSYGGFMKASSESNGSIHKEENKSVLNKVPSLNKDSISAIGSSLIGSSLIGSSLIGSSLIGSSLIGTDNNGIILEPLDDKIQKENNSKAMTVNVSNTVGFNKIDSKNQNTNLSNRVQLCVKDQRILKEIADLEQRENEILMNRKNIAFVSYSDKNNNITHSETQKTILVDSDNVSKNIDSSNYPESFQKFLKENVVS